MLEGLLMNFTDWNLYLYQSEHVKNTKGEGRRLDGEKHLPDNLSSIP